MTDVPISEELKGFTDNLEASLKVRICEPIQCRNIILGGVGGSAVSGDISSDCCFGRSSKRIHLCKYPELPTWVGEDSLAVISSYSGNTLETLEMYHYARNKGCKIVCLTSGGILKDLALKNGDALAELPTGMQPRHAIGYMIGYTLDIIRAAGGPDLSSDILSFIPSLREYRDTNAVPSDGLSSRLAESLIGKVAVICSDPSLGSASFRWKTQINENSKYVAFSESSPRLLGESESWKRLKDGNYHLILLADCDAEGNDRGNMLKFGESLKDSDVPVTVVKLGGPTSMENLFRAIILGDYMSVKMAELRGIDPAEVPPVMQLKSKLSNVKELHRNMW